MVRTQRMPRILIPADEPDGSSGRGGSPSPSPAPRLEESLSRKGLLPTSHSGEQQEPEEQHGSSHGTESSHGTSGSRHSLGSVKLKAPSGYSELGDTLSPLPLEARSPLRSPIWTTSPVTSPFGNNSHRGSSPFRSNVRQTDSPGRSAFGSSPARSAVGLRSPLRSILTPSVTFKRIAEAKEEVSRSIPSGGPSFPARIREGLSKLGHTDWATLKQQGLGWLRNPKNLALLLWGLAVAVSGAILFMVMVGMLNGALPRKKDRDAWFEVNNQILNALFTLMCLYLHPSRFYHSFLLYRWEPRDVIKMRNIYSKNGTRKLHEWFHMTVVVLLLHLNCLAQYALCGLNWGYKRSERPAIGVGVCLSFAIGCSAAAGIYTILSPLGREFEAVDEDEYTKLAASVADNLEQGGGDAANVALRNETSLYDIRFMKFRLLEKRMSFAQWDGGKEVEHPVWKGGLWDWRMVPGISVLSTLCCVCVFGWNMDRLGFGNRYVHIVTFILLLSAPYWIFTLAAVNIDNYFVRHGIGGAGVALCVFGLLYGGFWRIKMRETFNLPASTWCFRNPRLTDCTQWLFCSICSLCQEVRTAESYDIRDDKFYVMRGSGKRSLSLPRYSGANSGRSNPFSPRPPFPAEENGNNSHSTEEFTNLSSAAMVPPVLQSIGTKDGDSHALQQQQSVAKVDDSHHQAAAEPTQAGQVYYSIN